MRRISFRARLIAGAILWIAIGLAASWLVTENIFRRHLTTELTEELDHHGTELAQLLTFDASGHLSLRQPLSDHRFNELGSGYYWQVRNDRSVLLRSPSLAGHTLPVEAEGDPETLGHLPGPTGSLIYHVRTVPPSGADPAMHLLVGIDTRHVDDVLHAFDLSLGLSLGVLGLGLAGAVLAQVTYGLWPLSRIRQSLAAIRSGKARRMPDDLPPEVAPLADSLNDMIAANDEIVRRARVQAGNLAHALKTPLAVLMQEVSRLEAAGSGGAVLQHECERMQRQIDYQLSMARAAVSRGRPYAAVPLAPAVTRILSALARLPGAERLDFDIDERTPGLAVTCETGDLDEILGNLLENAFKWARSEVRVVISAAETAAGPDMALVRIEDDGPGLPVEAHERVFGLGERLDESRPGTGLGLTIVRDLTELYGGRVWIDSSPGGGTTVSLRLPR